MKLNLNQVSLEVCAGLPEQFPRSPKPQIAFSGRSNVGKSSLINTLLGRKSLARVSGEPGKTITVNFYDVDKKLYLVDLPGYGYAKRSPAEKERLGLLGESYFQQCQPLLVVQLIDMKVGPTADDATMLNFLIGRQMPFIVAATKADKLNKTERAKALERIPVPAESVIPFSSLKGEGKDDLWSVIYSCLAGD